MKLTKRKKYKLDFTKIFVIGAIFGIFVVAPIYKINKAWQYNGPLPTDKRSYMSDKEYDAFTWSDPERVFLSNSVHDIRNFEGLYLSEYGDLYLLENKNGKLYLSAAESLISPFWVDGSVGLSDGIYLPNINDIVYLSEIDKGWQVSRQKDMSERGGDEELFLLDYDKYTVSAYKRGRYVGSSFVLLIGLAICFALIRYELTKTQKMV